MWIGANDLQNEGDWNWLDGTSAKPASGNYNNWKSKQPDNWANRIDIQEDCASILRANGKWNDLECSTRLAYICQRKLLLFTDQYQLYFSHAQNTWAKADKECQKDGARLIKIDSPSLTKIVQKNSNEDRWIGASDSLAEGQWKWLDGSDATQNTETYSNWNNGEPSDGGSQRSEDCAIATRDGKWNDVRCSRHHKFICQRSLPTTVSHENHTFTFYRTEKANWDAAKAACANRGSRLVEIYDKATDDVIRNNIKNGGAEFFCGGSIREGKVTWQSGRNSAYSNWLKGNPNNGQRTKIALSIIGWKNVSPSANTSYICEMANLSVIALSKSQLRIEENGDTEVTCSANGIPSAKVFWMFSSKKVKTRNRQTVYQQTGDGISVLHVGRATLMSEGTYTCVAENQAGNFSKTMRRTLKLTVPSVPITVFAEVLNCSSTIVVKWKENRLATNVKHSITIKNSKNDSEIYEFFNYSGGILTFEARKWMTYDITVTPCPGSGVCKRSYEKSYHTNRTVGRPEKPQNLTATLSGRYICSISWMKSNNDPTEYITNFKVTISKRLKYQSPGKLVTESRSDVNFSANETTYNFEGKPNTIHKIGIQAKTCAGYGDIHWSSTTCVTEPKAPKIVEKPIPEATVTNDGTMKVTISIPSQDNGQISCIFVIVKVHEGDEKVLKSEYDKIYTWNDLVRANETGEKEYISLALDLKSVTEHQLSDTIGDERKTACDSSFNTARPKRRAVNNVLVGRNLKLDPQTNYSIFVVTSSPSTSEIMFKASESVYIMSVPKSEIGVTSTTLAGGAAGGGVAFILLLVAIVVVIKKQMKATEKHTAPPLESEYADIDIGHRQEQMDESQYAGIGEHPYEMSDVVYRNNRTTIHTEKRTETDIPMQEFEKTYNVMLNDQGAAFTEQFQELIRTANTLTLSVECASNPAFKAKNRYKNILPFDSTRVSIDHTDDGYINACYIDGFEQKKKFIAAQGPLAKTVNDFWLMIVEQKVSVIVMLAKCFEAGKRKCERYWPDIGETSRFGSIIVTNMNEVQSCGFLCRTLTVKARLEVEYKNTISQYHFLTWPDHGFPLTTSHILRMHRQVVKTYKSVGSTSPIVVHCSAGAGRTGTFIGFDFILNESESVGNADVFGCVAKMRSQRVEMVQNCDQFILVHKLLLESYVFRDTDISREEVLQRFADPKFKKKATAEEFANLSRVKPMDMTKKKYPQKICAYDRTKIKLYEDGKDIAKHLSASFVEAYDDSMIIIISKQPAEAKIGPFWKVVYNQKVTAIVTITEDEQDSLEYLNHVPGGEFTIYVDSEEVTTNFTVKKLQISGPQHETTCATHLHLELNPNRETRKNVTKINECVNRVQKELRESHGAALIHCKSGTGMSGVFCAMMNILERLAVEDRVDIFRAVKDLRDCKEGIIETRTQYALCFEGVVEYLRNFDTYSNFL